MVEGGGVDGVVGEFLGVVGEGVGGVVVEAAVQCGVGECAVAGA